MKNAVKMLRPQLKEFAERLFPKLTYARRFRIWQKTEPELRLLPALCSKEGVALDVGANEGFFVHHLLPHAESVVAFEPLPQMLIRRRQSYTDKVQIVPAILSDREGQGELRYPAGGYMTATIAESNSAAWESGRTVKTVVAPMRTLDSFQLTQVGFIKIDVEGHEEAVLRGGLATLKREMPNLMIEIEERHSPGSLHRVSTFLREIGYCGYFLKGVELMPISQFDPRRDQVIQNGRTGHYINNFLFFPEKRADAMLEKARPYL